jgi:hypothetical protein
MLRVIAPGLVIVAGLTMSACGGSTLSTQRAAPVTAAPPMVTTTTAPHVDAACSQMAPPAQCRLESTAIHVWTEVQSAQAQATQLQGAEEQYATCISYAALDQSLAGRTTPANAPVWKACPTTGLTSAVVLQIQQLIMET